MVTAADYPPLKDRPIKNTIVLFDVDGTLTPARQQVSPEMLDLIKELRKKVAIGFVGGSDLPKQQEQLGTDTQNITDLFDFAFPENGVTAYKNGKQLKPHAFIEWIGEDKYKQLVNTILHYLADLDIPIKRGTFVEYRRGMINVSPIGRNANNHERAEYEKFDKAHQIREKLVEHLKQKLPDLGLTYSIGGQISIDIFPAGWEKTFSLGRLEEDANQPDGVKYDTIHFFGDKTFKGGNDYEIYHDPRVTGHAINSPEETAAEVKKLFFS